MTQRTRIASFFFTFLGAALLLGLGTWAELRAVDWLEFGAVNPSLTQTALFFGVLNFNILVLAVFVFLVLRSAVQLAVDRKKGVFGSSLRIKLVSAFVFFALLPTVILLYMTSKFVNAHFEKLMPGTLREMTEQSRVSEKAYQQMIALLLDHPQLGSGERPFSGLSFSYNPETSGFTFSDDMVSDVRAEVMSTVRAFEARNRDQARAVWIGLDRGRMVAVRRNPDGHLTGLLGPVTIHPHWQLTMREFGDTGPVVGVLQVSYYVMLVVLTLLILFSATWLGLTIAREYTVPIQVLARATDSVAQGDYSVEIDEIISDDEMGQLAQSFRSMVADLKAGSERERAVLNQLQEKAHELFEKSEHTAVLLAHVPSAIVALSADGRVTSWNERATQVFGVSEEETLGQELSRVFNLEFYEQIVRPGLAQLSAPSQARTDAAVPRIRPSRTASFSGVIDGQEKNLVVKLARMTEGSGRSECIMMIEDVTELARAQRTAAWHDVARRVAHEIKNPLTPITLGVQRLIRRFQAQFEGKDLEIFRDCTQVVLDSTDSIRRLVDEFIKFARMPPAVLQEGNLLKTAQQAVNAFQQLDDVTVVFRARVVKNDRRVDLASEQVAERGSEYKGFFDRDQIARLISNLVSNAVDAVREIGGPTEPVRVVVDVLPDDGLFVVHVVDSGPGIPPDIRSRIFDPYFSKKKGGTGLGLAIVRQIVHEHHGEIRVADHHPRGAEFMVVLPFFPRRSPLGAARDGQAAARIQQSRTDFKNAEAEAPATAVYPKNSTQSSRRRPSRAFETGSREKDLSGEDTDEC